jgi:hypothetical protein
MLMNQVLDLFDLGIADTLVANDQGLVHGLVLLLWRPNLSSPEFERKRYTRVHKQVMLPFASPCYDHICALYPTRPRSKQIFKPCIECARVLSRPELQPLTKSEGNYSAPRWSSEVLNSYFVAIYKNEN